MIYITNKNGFLGEGLVVKNVWSVNCDDVEQKYIDFIHEKAKEINIVINPHWLNVMNWEDHHKYLSIEEYKFKEKQWQKIRRQWNIDKFIAEVLKGRKERFVNINRF